MTRTASVLVMAKAPGAGQAKTRLRPLLGVDGCAALQAALIRRTSRLAASAAPTYVAVTPADAQAEVGRLVPPGVTVMAQSEGNLGERMSASVSAVYTATGGPVVVVGTDAPTLTADILRKAAASIAPEAVVLGPAQDGGYYLIGVPGPAPAVFDISPSLWSGPQVLQATLAAAAQAGYRTSLLEPLRDLDTPADAHALLADHALPPAIAALLTSGGRPTWLTA